MRNMIDDDALSSAIEALAEGDHSLPLLSEILSNGRKYSRRRRSGRVASAFALVAAVLGAIPLVARLSTDSPPASPASSLSSAATSSAYDSEVDRAIVFRTHLGLNTDRAFVEALYAADAPPDVVESETAWGLRVTTDEIAVLEDIESLTDSLFLIKAYGRSEASDEFGGVYLSAADPSSSQVGQVAVALFTDNLDLHRDQLERFFPFPDKLVVRQSEYAEAAMEDLVDRINADVEDLRSSGVVLRTAGYHILDETILVRVDSPIELAYEVLRDRYGEFPLIVELWAGFP